MILSNRSGIRDTQKLERHHRVKPLFENVPDIQPAIYPMPVTLDERAPAPQGPQDAARRARAHGDPAVDA